MVNVTIPFSEEAFSSLMERSYVHGKLRGHVIYSLKAVKDWDHLLGGRWYIHVLDKWNDFSYVWRPYGSIYKGRRQFKSGIQMIPKAEL